MWMTNIDRLPAALTLTMGSFCLCTHVLCWQCHAGHVQKVTTLCQMSRYTFARRDFNLIGSQW